MGLTASVGNAAEHVTSVWMACKVSPIPLRRERKRIVKEVEEKEEK
jgi:hypothetical protein